MVGCCSEQPRRRHLADQTTLDAFVTTLGTRPAAGALLAPYRLLPDGTATP